MFETIIKVLLIEDDPEDSMLLQDLLAESKRSRFSVDTVTTGVAGLEQLHKNRFDIILLDYQLPDTDGLELLKQIQKIHPQTPVVVVTSHGDRNLQTRALDAGASEYLEKGSITTDLLERTCIYANGLSQATLGRFPELKIIIDQMSSSCKELSEIHTELLESRIKIDALIEQNTERHTELLTVIRNLAKFRWLLDWIADHKAATILLIICILVLLFAAGVLLQNIDLELLQKILELRKGVTLVQMGILG